MIKKIIIIAVVVAAITYFYFQNQVKKATNELDFGLATGVKVTSMNFDNTNMVLPIWINNPTNFNLTVSNMQLDVFIGNVYLGQASITRSYEIRKFSKSVVPIQLTLANVNAMTILIDVNSKLNQPDWRSKINIKLRGRIRAESGILYLSSIPIELDGTYKEWMG